MSVLQLLHAAQVSAAALCLLLALRLKLLMFTWTVAKYLRNLTGIDVAYIGRYDTCNKVLSLHYRLLANVTKHNAT